MEKVGPRRAELLDMRNRGGHVRMRFKFPPGAVGVPRYGVLDGHARDRIMHHRFLDYGPWAGRCRGGAAGSCGGSGGGGGGVRAVQFAGPRAMSSKPGDPV